MSSPKNPERRELKRKFTFMINALTDFTDEQIDAIARMAKIFNKEGAIIYQPISRLDKLKKREEP